MHSPKLIWAALAAAAVLSSAALAQDEPKDAVPHGNSACPESRAYLEQALKTRPEDGPLYDIQRQALDMPVRDLVRVFGGVDEAYAVAARTRADAQAQLSAGAKGAERRFHQDTILRADALVEILDCLQTGEGA